ncbi:hypothetical protein, partial [Yersinia similis]|uniref:hypothetical protein n=1 Tax=Yersinia similis TaxID=367190 RepID=UPI001C97C8C3
RLCKNSVFALSEYYPRSGTQDIFDIDCIRCDLYVEADRGFCGLIWSANGLLLGVKTVTPASRIALAA